MATQKMHNYFMCSECRFFPLAGYLYYYPLHRINEDGEHERSMGCSCRSPEGMAREMGVESKLCPKYFPMILFRNEKLHAGRQKRNALKMENFNCFSSSACFFWDKTCHWCCKIAAANADRTGITWESKHDEVRWMESVVQAFRLQPVRKLFINE